MTVGVNKDNHWFLLDCQYGRYDPTETMDKIFEAVAKYKPLKVGIEGVAYQSTLEHYLNKEMPKRNIFFPIQILRAEKKKEHRIEFMQPRFSSRTVWFPRNAHFLPELEMELLSFTPKGCKSQHDDLVDALAYMEQIALPPAGAYELFNTDDLPLAGAL